MFLQVSFQASVRQEKPFGATGSRHICWRVNQENRPVFDFLQKGQLMAYLSLNDRDLVLATLNALK